MKYNPLGMGWLLSNHRKGMRNQLGIGCMQLPKKLSDWPGRYLQHKTHRNWSFVVHTFLMGTMESWSTGSYWFQLTQYTKKHQGYWYRGYIYLIR